MTEMPWHITETRKKIPALILDGTTGNALCAVSFGHLASPVMLNSTTCGIDTKMFLGGGAMRDNSDPVYGCVSTSANNI
jgi:hypothetical protein